MKEFPIPVVALGPGSQPVEAGPECLEMPTDMDVFRPPRMAFESDAVVADGVCAQLRELLGRMQAQGFSRRRAVRLDLAGLDPTLLRALSDALGEGEVAVRMQEGDGETLIQESAFAGVWRVLRHDAAGACVEDVIEACAIPPRVIATARSGAGADIAAPALPDGAMNSPALLAELRSASQASRDEAPAHVINLTLLPLTPEDLQYLGAALGAGTTTLLSRGYGKCRITSTALRDVWWVQYFNGMDKLILNTVEAVDIPEVALAAEEDWRDSIERIGDLIGVLSAH